MLNKIKVIETINTFPDNFSIDELFEKMVIILKIERGNLQSLNKQVISENDLKLKMNKYHKKKNFYLKN